MPIIIYCLVKESIFAKVTFCKSFVAVLIIIAIWVPIGSTRDLSDECLLFFSAVLFHSTVV